MQNRNIIFGAIFLVLAFLPRAHAVIPSPDGCYPNFTTAEGCNALKFLTNGVGNTALGGSRFFGILTPAPTPPLAPQRWCSITPIPIPRLVLQLCCSTRLAIRIRPLDETRSPTTRSAQTTTQWVPSRYLTTTQVAWGLQTSTTPLAVTHS